MRDWVRLEQHDDWGTEYLSLPGKGLREPLGLASLDLGLDIRGGQRLFVRWPDGSESEEPIVHRPYSVEVSDHGNSSRVSGKRPGVETESRGFRTFVPLRDLDVDRQWAEGLPLLKR